MRLNIILRDIGAFSRVTWNIIKNEARKVVRR